MAATDRPDIAMDKSDLGARIVLDVWGGENSMDHIARLLPTIDRACAIAQSELRAGYLVNMRSEVAWGNLTPFDHRVGLDAISGALQ